MNRLRSPFHTLLERTPGGLSILLGTGSILLSACGPDFQASSVYPRRTYEYSQRTLAIYGVGMDQVEEVRVLFRNKEGVLEAIPLTEVTPLDEYTLTARMPDISGRVEHPIYPYREFVAYSQHLTAGLYDCGSGDEVVWTPGTTTGYCTATGQALGYAPFNRNAAAVPPGSADSSVLEYSTWYDSLDYCTYYLSPETSLTESQLQLLVPDYELGCFYLQGEGGLRTYQYCPLRLPAAEVSIQLQSADGRTSTITNGLSVLDYDLDYFNNSRYGTRVMGGFGGNYELALEDLPTATTATTFELDEAYAPSVAATLYSIGDGSAGSLGITTDLGYGTEQVYPVNSDPEAVALGDMNGDGLPDVVVAHSGDRTLALLELALDGDTGELVAGGSLQTLATLNFTPAAVALADMDLDGLLDAVVTGTRSDTTGALAIVLANPSGGYLTPIVIDVGTGPTSLAIGDLDEQNGPDIATLNPGSRTLSLCLNNGNGSCSSASSTSLGTSSTPDKLITGLVQDSVGGDLHQLVDLSGDGLVDVVYRNQTDNVGVLRLGSVNSTGAYLENGLKILSLAPASTTLADVNGDGSWDVIAADSEGNLEVARSDGNGGWKSAFKTILYIPEAQLFALDLDSDFDPDLIAVDPSAGTLTLLNNPSSINEYFDITLDACFL